MKFKYIILGKDLAKQENGFSGEGNWTLLKGFSEDGDEFYINLNEVSKEGEFIIKT